MSPENMDTGAQSLGVIDRMQQASGRNKLIAAGLGATIVLSGMFVATRGGESDATPVGGTSTTTESVPSDFGPELCTESWEMLGVDHGDQNRWFAKGLEDVRNDLDNNRPVDARNAQSEWLNGKPGRDGHPGVKNDAKLLAGGYNAMISMMGIQDAETHFVKPEELKDAENCATPKATEVVDQMTAWLAVSGVTIGNAISGYNTGTNEKGDVTVAEHAGLTGDTRAILVELPNKCVMSVLLRCGQIVIDTKCPGNFNVVFPPGKTDNDHPETPGTPGTTTTTKPGGSETTTSTAPMKDDRKGTPGEGNPAGNSGGVPDNGGNGSTDQTHNGEGYTPGETYPKPPVTVTTRQPAPPATTPASTAPRPVSTNPPAPASTSVSTSAPSQGTVPKP